MDAFTGYALCVLFKTNQTLSGRDKCTLVFASGDESVAKNIPAIVRDYLKATNSTDTVVDGNSLGQMQFELFCVSCTETFVLKFSVKRRITTGGRTTWLLVMTSDPELDVSEDEQSLALAEEGLANARKRMADGSQIWGMRIVPDSEYPFSFKSFRTTDLSDEFLM